jgi:hypothetical protein
MRYSSKLPFVRQITGLASVRPNCRSNCGIRPIGGLMLAIT